MNLSAYAAPLSLTPAATPVRNPLGVYGKPEYMLMGKTLIKKRPTEIRACKHILRPDDPEFIPAPMRGDEAWCCGCRKILSVANFHGNRARPNGLQPHCKDCRKLLRKMGKSIDKVKKWHWYRAPSLHEGNVRQNIPVS